MHQVRASPALQRQGSTCNLHSGLDQMARLEQSLCAVEQAELDAFETIGTMGMHIAQLEESLEQEGHGVVWAEARCEKMLREYQDKLCWAERAEARAEATAVRWRAAEELEAQASRGIAALSDQLEYAAERALYEANATAEAAYEEAADRVAAVERSAEHAIEQSAEQNAMLESRLRCLENKLRAAEAASEEGGTLSTSSCFSCDTSSLELSEASASNPPSEAGVLTCTSKPHETRLETHASTTTSNQRQHLVTRLFDDHCATQWEGGTDQHTLGGVIDDSLLDAYSHKPALPTPLYLAQAAIREGARSPIGLDLLQHMESVAAQLEASPPARPVDARPCIDEFPHNDASQLLALQSTYTGFPVSS